MSSASYADRVKALVEANGVGGGLQLAVNEFLEDARASDSVQGMVKSFEAFKVQSLHPLMEQYLSAETSARLARDLDAFMAKLKAEKKAEQRLSKRLSKRLSAALGGGKKKEKEEEEAEQPQPEESVPVADVVEDDDEDDDEDEEEAAAAPIKSDKLQWAARLMTGYEGNLTAKQAADLETFREIMYASEYKEDVLRWRDGPDRLLLRFLRAECTKKRKFNIKKSTQRLKNTLQWRRDNNIDDLLDNPPAEWERFLEVNGEVEIIDNEGRLVVFTRAAYLANYMDIKEFDQPTWKKCIARLVEHRMQRLREESDKRGYEISAAVMVYDLRGGLGFSARRMIPFIKMLNGIASAHYPEMVDCLYAVSVPGIFNTLFGMVSVFLDPVTLEKIKIYSGSSKQIAKFFKDLKSHCSDDQLPKEYGGSADIAVPMPAHAAKKGVKMPKPFPGTQA